MRIIDLYVDSKHAYLKLEEEVSFFLKIDDQEIEIPSKLKKDDGVYQIHLATLEKLVEKEGRFSIGVKVDGTFERLEFKELLKSRVSGRYFHAKKEKKKLYITTDGYLKFAYGSKKELFINSQKTGNINIQKAEICTKDSGIYVQLVLAEKMKGQLTCVSLVDFDTEERYVTSHCLSDQILEVDLSKVPQMGRRYRIVIDSMTTKRMESQLVKMVEGKTVEVSETEHVWQPAVENGTVILSTNRKDVNEEAREITVRSVGQAFGNCIELEVNLDDLEIKDVITRHRALDKIIKLDHIYHDRKLKINFSNLNGFSQGNFLIYVRNKRNWYFKLYDDEPIPSFSEQSLYFFVHGTEKSARYAHFGIERQLRYNIKSVSSYQRMQEKTISFDHLCLLNDYFLLELSSSLIVEDVILGENNNLEFHQNRKDLFIRIPEQASIDTVKYLSIVVDDQLFKLEAGAFFSTASAKLGLVLFTGHQERLAIKPLNTEYYVTSGKISKKIEVEIPNLHDKNLNVILTDPIKIEKVITINRKDLSIKALNFKQREQRLEIQPRNFEPFIVDSVVSQVLDIVFVTHEGFALPFVKDHKQLAEEHKKQHWQVSEKDREMLYRIYVNISGGLSVYVKDNYYAENWEKVPVKDNVILYESQFGKRISDSGYAIFKYLVDNPHFGKFEHIWVIDEESSQAPEALEKKYQDACRFVIRDTRVYKKTLLESKYLITSHTFQDYFSKKPDQIYINTWHGTALKSLGYDIIGETSSVRNVVRNFMMSDYIISPNDHMTHIFTNGYKLRGAYQGTILEGGYPRNDLVITTDKTVVAEKLKYFSVKFDRKKPTILYAPTYRGSDVANPMNQMPEIKELVTRLQRKYGVTHNVLLKVHPFTFQSASKDDILQKFLIPDYIDTNEILSIVDLLISDFSSIFFDYLITDKPIIFYIPDKDEYMKNRGVYVDFDDLPGLQAINYSQLERGIDLIISERKTKQIKKYVDMKNKYLTYDDGKTTERYVRRIFKNEKSNQIKEITVDSNKKKLVMYMGDMDSNGITSSALNLLDHLDYDKYDVTIMMYLQTNQKSLDNIERINKFARIMFVFGEPLYTSEGISKDEALLQAGFTEEEWKDMLSVYRRNMSNRVFPSMSFDVAIEFCSYGRASVRHLLSVEANRHIFYLHSEMGRDAKKIINNRFVRINNFNMIFTLYAHASKLVSVSKALMKENIKQLAYVTKPEQMTYARNVINYKRILEQAKEEIDLNNLKSIDGFPVAPIDTSTGLNFVTSGRLSVEKNQIALVKAFAEFEKEYPGARLFILGKGILQSDINKEVVRLKMLGKITMLGHLDNPFAFISKMDYFVFPSLYEGQGLALLEALVLGKKVMSSNIAASIEMLGTNEYGIIAKGTTPNALYEGLQELVKCSDFKQFDYVKYNQKAIEDFNRLVEDK